MKRSGLMAIGAGVALVSYGALTGGKELVHLVAGREMLVENLGAFAFLATAIVFFVMARGERRQASRLRLVQLLGLAAFYFLAFGEEASWGQHWLGFETPEELQAINAQQEVNLHNLWLVDSYEADAGKQKGFAKKKGLAALLLNSNRLFDLIMVGLFWLLPAAAHRRSPLAGWIARWGTPLPAWPFALLLLANYLLTGVAEWLVVDGMIRHLAVSEVREFNYAVLGLLNALELWRRAPPAAPPAASPAGG